MMENLRFFDKVKKTNDCWLWVGSIRKNGYGHFFYDGKIELAHRASWELHKGKIPKGKQINHKCFNRACVNPEHLYAGTQVDNMRDAKIAGTFRCIRVPIGEKNPKAKLTEDQVREIRDKHIPGIYGCYKLARDYDIGASAIYSIVARKTWKHVE